MQHLRESAIQYCRLGNDLGSLRRLLKGTPKAWLFFSVRNPPVSRVGAGGAEEEAKRCPVAENRGPTRRAAKGAASNPTKPGCVGLRKGTATICSLLDQHKKAQADSEVEEEENGVGGGLFSLGSAGSPIVFLETLCKTSGRAGVAVHPVRAPPLNCKQMRSHLRGFSPYEGRSGVGFSLLSGLYFSSEARGIGMTPEGVGFLRIKFSCCLI